MIGDRDVLEVDAKVVLSILSSAACFSGHLTIKNPHEELLRELI